VQTTHGIVAVYCRTYIGQCYAGYHNCIVWSKQVMCSELFIHVTCDHLTTSHVWP